MKTKISETRLKDSLLTLKNSLETKIEKDANESGEKLENMSKKLQTKIDNFQEDVQFEFGKSDETK